MPWEDLSHHLRQVCLAWEAHDLKLSAQALNIQHFTFRRPDFPDLAGATVWWTEEAQTQAGEMLLRQLSRKLRLTVVESPYQATVHVWLHLTSPANPLDLWMVALHGKMVLDLCCFRSEGKRGGFMTYNSAVAVQRLVHVSSHFARARPRLAHDVLYYCKPHFVGSSRWRRESDLAKFLAQAAKAIAAKFETDKGDCFRHGGGLSTAHQPQVVR